MDGAERFRTLHFSAGNLGKILQKLQRNGRRTHWFWKNIFRFSRGHHRFSELPRKIWRWFKITLDHTASSFSKGYRKSHERSHR